MESFKKLGIIEPILKAIREEGFKKPSDIQQSAIPVVASGKDIIAGSATGSGKTLAFASGIIQNTIKGKGIQALILTPTRELAEQVRKDFVKFSKYKPLEIVSVYGGVSINPQIEKLRTCEIVIGTPGRVIDHLERGTLRLNEVKTLVLDEADRMLDMGFVDDVEKIIRNCPKKRQTLLFSATISGIVSNLIKKHMKYPAKISIQNQVDPSKLKQIYYDVPDNMKISLLVYLLKHEDSKLVMVFCNTRKFVDFVANNLNKMGIAAHAIHGGFTQDKRTNVMKMFHDNSVNVLVCTDVAARGLDIKGVSHVYNYDIPNDSKQYVHRIGRTARAGKEGKAINLLSPKDFDAFRVVLSENMNLDVEKAKTPNFKRLKIMAMDKKRYFGRKKYDGPRNYKKGYRDKLR